MAIRSYAPTTPARRGMTSRDLARVSTRKPERSLITKHKMVTGRNQQGKITVRHRGGGVKRFYRLVDFKGAYGETAKVKAIEYDPNRSANIALIENEAGQKFYVLATAGLKLGQTLQLGVRTEIKAGNRAALRSIPVGSTIHNIELTPGGGGQLVRSAGAGAQITAKEGKYAQIKLPSGEIRLIRLDGYATIGSVGNEAHQNIKWGSAGRKRRLGIRPRVGGKKMNPVDHPMGGGEGKSGPGRLPRTPWGKIAIGGKTRRRKATQKYIIRSRHAAKR